MEFIDIQGILKDPFNRYLVAALILLGIFLLIQSLTQPALQSELIVDNQTNNISLIIDFFYLPTCPHCAEQKLFNKKLITEFPEIKFIYHDVTNPDELALLNKMVGLNANYFVPATFFKNKSFVGFESEETTGQKIRGAVLDCLEECKKPSNVTNNTENMEFKLPFIGKINPMEYSLPVLAIVLGLVDGFNPCAMWVLVYLITLVMNLNDKKKRWFIVGSFVLASGVLYFLFMTAWLNAFLIIGYIRIITIIIGLVALGVGILSIKEYIITKGNLICKVGNVNDKKRTISQVESIVSSQMTITTICAIIILAFVINSTEFICSAAIPAVFTQVLALSKLSFLEYYGYIALYDLFFMLDDLIIFGLVVFAISSSVGEKYAKHCKIIGGIILFILGILLLFAPHTLH